MQRRTYKGKRVLFPDDMSRAEQDRILKARAEAEADKPDPMVGLIAAVQDGNQALVEAMQASQESVAANMAQQSAQVAAIAEALPRHFHDMALEIRAAAPKQRMFLGLKPSYSADGKLSGVTALYE